MINSSVEASYLEISFRCRGLNSRVCKQHFANSMVDLTTSFVKTMCYSVKWCSTCFKTVFKQCLYTDFDYGLLLLSRLDYWFSAFVTVQQGIPFSLKHLMPALVYPGISVWQTLISVVCGLREWLRFVVFSFLLKHHCPFLNFKHYYRQDKAF